MEHLYREILAEIRKLRLLKRYILEGVPNQSDSVVSNICLSADILLLPLYWYVTSTKKCESRYMSLEEYSLEEYMQKQIISFEDKAPMLIPHLINRTQELDERYSSKPFKKYRSLLKDCFPQYSLN